MIATFFNQLKIKEEDLKEEILRHATVTNHDKGTFLIRDGEYIKVLKIVLSGRVRVYQVNEEREILIYYLGHSETCTLSLSACFEDCLSNVNAIVEEKAVVLNIPVRLVKGWCDQYPSWNDFTINTFRHSYSVLIEKYAELAFKPLKARLFEYLIEKSDTLQNCTLLMSHQQIANELGTTREVVSRLLKKIEKEGLVRLGQKSIQIIQ